MNQTSHPLYHSLQSYIKSSEINELWYSENHENIVLIPDGIELIWLQFDKEDMKAPANNTDIWVHNGFSYFTFERANAYAQELGKRLPSKAEWKKLVDFLPWDTENKVRFLMEVLWFPLSGFRCWDNSFFCNFWEDSWYWSSTWTVTHWYNLLFKKNYLNHGDFDFKGIWFLARCLKN